MHFVTAKYRGELFTPELNPEISFDALVRDIWSGQIEDVINVFAFDKATGVGSDITKKVAEACSEISHAECDEPHYEVCEFIERHGFEPFKLKRESFYDRADRLYAEAQDARANERGYA